MVGGIFILILFILVVSALCSGDSSSSNTAPKRSYSTTQKRNTHIYYNMDPYCECPSCGAPYYDGYCEECGYPDINQGWLGENY